MITGKHYAFIYIIAVLVLIFAFGCSRPENGLDGTWNENPDGQDRTLVFSGKDFTLNAPWGEFRGTYSITDDMIELLVPGEDARILPFSHDGNTITIGGDQFTRISD